MPPTRTPNFLRNNWLLILLIVVGLLWWRVYDVFAPSFTNLDHNLQNIDYWSIASSAGRFWAALIGYALLGIITFVYIWRHFILRHRVIVMALASILCTIATCSSSANIFKISWFVGIDHLMSVQYENKVYHLAVAYTGYSWDTPIYPAYTVFECDSSGHICSRIEVLGSASNTPNIDKTKLVVLENSLFFENWGKRVQILPSQKQH